jgi:acyl phosphate:glycerol-3-phosphate acyltransferase
MNLPVFIVIAVVSYLIGAIPFGLLYGFARGVDIRKVGSKNIGATNVSRQFGFLGGFVPVFILDFLKGTIPVLIVRFSGVVIDPGLLDISMLIVGILAIVGHMFPVYIGFKGGKGVATTAGAFLAIVPIEALICLLVFLFTLLVARAITILNEKPKNKKTKAKASFIKLLFSDLQKNVGISSVVAAVFLPISILVLESHRIVLLVIAFIIAALLVFQHRSNLAKLFQGDKKSK